MKHLVLLLLVASLGVVGASLSPDSPVCRKGRQTVWSHVYRPDRLKIIAQCFTVSGTVEHISQARDGDTHIGLTLDPAFEHILNDGNRQYQHGALVVEIVCEYPVTLEVAKTSCEAFHNPLGVPQVGDHIMVVGPLVEDRQHHSWREIHPVYDWRKE
jgi:hypothetical protein